MNAKDFNGLGYTAQTEAALKGTFLAARITEDFYIKLYNLENFYVEVFFDDRNHLITHFRAFKHTPLLTPYLEELIITV